MQVFSWRCLVRMSETMADPLIVTTDSDFHVYRRHSRQVVPVLCPRRTVIEPCRRVLFSHWSAALVTFVHTG